VLWNEISTDVLISSCKSRFSHTESQTIEENIADLFKVQIAGQRGPDSQMVSHLAIISAETEIYQLWEVYMTELYNCIILGDSARGDQTVLFYMRFYSEK
jgi:hypothetical protein